jgi:zinc protease
MHKLAWMVALGSLAAATVVAQEPASGGALSLKVEQGSLPNGLTVLTVEEHRAPVVSVQVWVHTGSKNERPGITGISHLFEHMMFKGSRKYGPEEHARTVQANGGQLNAFTTQDVTAYYEDFPSDRLELAFQLEAERFQNLKLTEQTLKTEREVVKEERRLRTDNSPNGVAVEEFFAAAFKAHPYQWPVVGWMTDLDALTLEDCREYFRARYAPNNAVLVVAGDTTHEEVMKLAKKHFARWRRQPAPPPVPSAEPEQKGERRLTVRHAAQAPLLLGGWHTPAYNHADLPALEVLSRILSDGQSSRLYTRLVYTEQTAVSAYGGLMQLEHPGIFYAYAGVRPGGDPARVEAAFMQEVDRFKTEPVTDEELQKARTQLETGFVYGLKRVHGVASTVAQDHLLGGDATAINRKLAGWNAVTKEDLQRVAQKYFTPDNRTVVTLVPEAAGAPTVKKGGQP